MNQNFQAQPQTNHSERRLCYLDNFGQIKPTLKKRRDPPPAATV